MANAAEVVQKIRDDLVQIDEEIRRHPYLEALQEAAVPRSAQGLYRTSIPHCNERPPLHRIDDPAVRSPASSGFLYWSSPG